MHNAELLTRLRERGRPATLGELIGDGFEPRWARDAANRLLAAGMITEDAEGRLGITKTAERAG